MRDDHTVLEEEHDTPLKNTQLTKGKPLKRRKSEIPKGPTTVELRIGDILDPLNHNFWGWDSD